MAYVQDNFLTNDILHEMVSSASGNQLRLPSPGAPVTLWILGGSGHTWAARPFLRGSPPAAPFSWVAWGGPIRTP